MPLETKLAIPALRVINKEKIEVILFPDEAKVQLQNSTNINMHEFWNLVYVLSS